MANLSRQIAILIIAASSLSRVAEANPPRAFVGHTNWVFRVEFSPNSKYLASASFDKTAKLWDVQTGKALLSLEHAHRVRGVAFSPDGKFLATCTDFSAHLWSVPEGKELGQFTPSVRVGAISYTPDGKTIAIGGGVLYESGSVWLWQPNENKVHLVVDTLDRVALSLDFSPDGESLAVGDGEGFVSIWNVANRKRTFTTKRFGYSVNDVQYSADGNTLVICAADLHFWDVSQKKLRVDIDRNAPGFGVAFSADGQHVAWAGTHVLFGAAKSGRAEVFDLKNGTPQGFIPYTGLTLYDVTFSPDGQFVALTGVNKNVIVSQVPEKFRGPKESDKPKAVE